MKDIQKPILSMRSIGKSFSGTQALCDIDFELIEGEVHSIVGANGAGKSTLLNILSGVFSDYIGSIIVDGEAAKITSPKQSQRLGIACVSQELNLVEDFSVCENIFLNSEPVKKGVINRKEMIEDCRRRLSIFDVELSPYDIISDISVSDCQLVEIIKALQKQSRILLLDEPTAALTSRETQTLYKIINDLKKHGVSIILISHRFEDVFQLSDRVTVLRDGRKVFVSNTGSTTVDEIVGHMLGRDIVVGEYQEKAVSKNKILEVSGLSTSQLHGVSFDLFEGETLGVVGRPGSGKDELLKPLFGIDALRAGRICVAGHSALPNTPTRAISMGVGYLSGNRVRDGLFHFLPVTDNIFLPFMKRFSTYGVLRNKMLETEARSKASELNIKLNDVVEPVSALSGGNQQKVILARWMSNSKSKIFLFEEPTRGIDVGSKVEIYRKIEELTGSGMGCIVVSSELDEILLLCDRIIVMERGSISVTLNTSETSKTELLKHVMGDANIARGDHIENNI